MDNIDITKMPQWIDASTFRDHAHGEYVVMLDNGYLSTAYFTYRDGGQILLNDESITKEVKLFIPNRATWFITEPQNPDSVKFLKERVRILQKEVDNGKREIKKLKKDIKK